TQDGSTLTIRNSNFKYTYANGQNLQYPLVADNWTTKNSSSPNSVAMGVVDTADWSKVVSDSKANNLFTEFDSLNPYYPSYNESEGFDTENSRVYMIKKDLSIESEAVTVVSNSFSVSAGQYLKVSVWVKTANVIGNGAFVALKNSSSGTASSNYYCVYHVSANSAVVVQNGWARYDFYVEGNKTSSKTMYLELGLGRKLSTNNVTESASGLIYFGGIEANNISRGEYNAHEQKTIESGKNYLSYSFYTDESNVTLSDWSKKGDNGLENKEVAPISQYEKVTYAQYEAMVGDGNMPFHYDTTNGEEHQLYMYRVRGNNTIKFNQFEVVPPAINKCYRLSMWIRTDIVPSSGAYVYLNAYDKDGNYVQASSSHFAAIQTPKNIQNDTYNGWVEYQFYIQPNETDVYSFELEISVGKRNNLSTNDMAYVAEISLYELEQHEYHSASTSDSVNKITLKSEITPSSSLINGSFINSNTSAENTNYPISPSNWDMIYAGSSNIVEEYDETKLAPNRSPAFWPMVNEENSTDVYSSIGGILYKSLDSTYYAPYGITSADFDQYVDDDAHSMLMIYNNQLTACGYKSSAITLSKNSFYRISVLAKGIGNAVPYVYLTNGAKTVYFSSQENATNEYTSVAFEEIDKNLTGGWTRYYVYVATGDTDQAVCLELWNGKREATPAEGYALGTVLFDQAACEQLTLTDETSPAEYSDLFVAQENQTALVSLQNADAQLSMVYTEEQKILSNAKNLFVIDYRYNDVNVENDFERVYNYSTEIKNKEKELAKEEDKSEINAMMTKLEAMVATFNAKHYEDLEEGTYYINWADNNESISDFRTHLNSIKNSDDDKDSEDEKTTEPIDWLIVSSLVVTVAMLGAIVGIIIRKFLIIHNKKKETVENNYQA
ncbi:MAG: hypothetical protein IKV38_00460, partial [Clostridia bacterium]|nr:hypothetical protein [Clostridia bacterium]